MGEIEHIEALVVVKAYPNPSASLGEACCVLGMTKDRGFVRIYPIPFRQLEDERQFAKYETIRIGVVKPKSDPRPNTFRPQLDTLEVISAPLPTTDKWRLRKEWLLNAASESMCEIQRKQRELGVSMGFFKPAEVVDVTQEEEPEKQWSAGDLSKLGQTDLFMTRENRILEKLPYRWRYKYRCSDPDCSGHHQSIIDWELGQLYRNLKSRGITDPDDIHQRVRAKYLTQLCGPDKDTYFFVGNLLKHPRDFMVLGVFWPPHDPQMHLL
jgi:hypothetical protein